MSKFYVCPLLFHYLNESRRFGKIAGLRSKLGGSGFSFGLQSIGALSFREIFGYSLHVIF